MKMEDSKKKQAESKAKEFKIGKLILVIVIFVVSISCICK